MAKYHVENEITVSQLKEKLDRKENCIVLDVRTPEELAESKIEGVIHMPVETVPDNKEKLPKDKEILVICGHGSRSRLATNFLRKNGFNAKNVEGGMAAWNAMKVE